MISVRASLRIVRLFQAIVSAIVISIMIAFGMPLSAQTKTDANTAPPHAHASDFDYLLGDWEFSGVNAQYGKMHGYWSAVRLENPKQVMDEYRVVGPKGEVYYSTTTLRAYSNARDEWDLVSMEDGSGLQNLGTGRKEGSEVHISQKFMGPDGNFSILRIRYYNIGNDSFSWSADRSSDDGKTWTKNFQTLDVKRIGAARTLPSLIPTLKQGH